MKRILIAVVITTISAFATFKVLAACGSYFQSAQADSFSGGPCPTGFSKTAYWTIYWTDGHVTTPPVQVTEPGDCFGGEVSGYQACYPGYDTPYFITSTLGLWNQVTHDPSTGIGGGCVYNSIAKRDHIFTYLCKGHCRGQTDWTNYFSTGCISGFIDAGGTCGRSNAFMNQCMQYSDYESETCSCTGGCGDGGSCSPILIDTAGNGFQMTSATNGPLFNLTGFGGVEGFEPVRHIGWTTANTDDGWLVLDRNGNGVIDNGMELFGTATPQKGLERNGFLALAEFDEPLKGGNGDGVINRLDTVFSLLQVWIDTNHNGVSEASELFTLGSLDISELELNYKESKKTDEHGNQFKYRAKVKGARGQTGRWAWDVYPVSAP